MTPSLAVRSVCAPVGTYPGDTTMATLAQVKALSAGGSQRIQR